MHILQTRTTIMIAFETDIILETDRVFVRPVRHDDIDEIAIAGSDPALWAGTTPRSRRERTD